MKKIIMLGGLVLCPFIFSGCSVAETANSLSPQAVMGKLQNAISDIGHSSTKSGKKIKGDKGERIQPWEVKKSTQTHGKLDVLFAIENVKTKAEAIEALKKLSRTTFEQIVSEQPENINKMYPNSKFGKRERYVCNGGRSTCCSGFWEVRYPTDNTFAWYGANNRCTPYEEDVLGIGVLELAGKFWVVVKDTAVDTRERSISGQLFDVLAKAGSGHFNPNGQTSLPAPRAWQSDIIRIYTQVVRAEKFPQFRNFVDIHLDSEDGRAENYRKMWSESIMEELDK